VLLLLGCLGLGGGLWAQVAPHLSLHQGTTLVINPVFPPLLRPARMLETGFSWLPSGQRPWHARFRYPRLSLSAWYVDPGNPAILGRAYALLPAVEMPFVQRPRWQLSYQLGSSLAFLDRPYDRATNPTNNVVGSRISNLTLLRLRAAYALAPPWRLRLDLSGLHFSNGHTRYPNLGINIPALGLGLSYHPGGAAIQDRPSRPPAAKAGHWRPALRLHYGLSGGKAPQAPRYPVYLASVYLQRPWRERLRWQAGLLYARSGYIAAFMQDHDIASEASGADMWVLFLGTEWMMGRFSFSLNLGPYLRTAYLMDYRLYTELGWRWYLRDQQRNPHMQPFLGAFVHAHSGEADFSSLALGFVF